MDSDFETMRIILSGSAGMTAREILKNIKTINKLGLPVGSNPTQWVKRDVNSVLYRMLKEGLVENKIRNSPRPYWKLVVDISNEEISIDESSNMPDLKEIGEEVEKWWAKLEL